MKTTQRTGEQGMSLIEMMVVVVIVAMCALWGMHSWRGYQQALKLEQHAQRLRLYLYGVQTGANNYNRSAILWVMSGKGGCVGTGQRAADCKAAGSKVFTVDDPEIELLDFSDNATGFYGLRNSAMPGHLTLKNAAGSLRIVLSARGRLRICSENQPLLGIASCQ
ncbi:prepilin peptidase-dependent protein [Rahnella sp. ChDrAdgB13]|jgi:prepilin peptidase dependent protein A|uniref:prepilin peptidase-dependent protein n=1 Tax=Rahnella sp. ChDrAdgB13 TaxID=1850581 RepID=UPI00244DB624|nr:prepilin peptidase-dependent protein [Rahnella sp. ChDrAdgB13]